MCVFYPAFTDLLAVVVKANVAALGEASAIVGKLHSHLVLTGWNWLARLRGKGLETDEVVGELCFSTLGVKTHAPERAALVNNDAFRSFRWHLDLSGDRKRLVLHDQNAVLGQPSHPAKQELRVSLDEQWPASHVSIEALDSAVIKR